MLRRPQMQSVMYFAEIIYKKKNSNCNGLLGVGRRVRGEWTANSEGQRESDTILVSVMILMILSLVFIIR